MWQNLRRQVQHELSTGIDLTRWVGSIGLAVAVGIVYFVAARLSLALLTKPEGVAVFWPAAGVSAGVLIALGSRARWPVVVGTMAATIAANLFGDRNLRSAVLFALCNAGEAVLAAWIIEHYFGSDFRLDKLRNVLGLAAAAIIGAAVSGIGGAVAYKLFHSTTTSMLTTWQHWFASDGLGIITVAPLLIELASASARPAVAERTRRRCFGGRRTGPGEWTWHFPAVGAVGDRWAGRRVVRAAAVACGSLPAGFCRGSRVHCQPFNRLDDHLWHWLFR